MVFVQLNRGYRYRRKQTQDDDGRREPRFFVFPVVVIQTAQVPGSTWGKVFLRHVEDYESYENRWDLIAEFLEATA